MTSTIKSTSGPSRSSKRSVHVTDAGTQSTRLRATWRLQMWVSVSGADEARIKRATA